MNSGGVRPWVWMVPVLLGAGVIVATIAKKNSPAKDSKKAATAHRAKAPETRANGRVATHASRAVPSPGPEQSPSPSSEGEVASHAKTFQIEAKAGIPNTPAKRDDNLTTAAFAAMTGRLREAGNQSLPFLEAALRNPSPEIRKIAAATLMEIGTEEAARLLLAALAGETDNDVKAALRLNLGAWSDPRATPAFADALQAVKDNDTRMAIAKALAPIITPDVARQLLANFAGAADDAGFRDAVAWVFLNAPPSAISMELAHFVNTTGDADALRVLLPAAAQVGDHACVAAMLEAYRRLGNNANFDDFMKALGGVSNPAAVSAFLEAVDRTDDPTDAWKLAAAWLSANGAPEAVDTLVKEIRNADAGSERRQVLLDHLGKVGNAASLDRLAKAWAAYSQDSELQRALARAMLNCGTDAILNLYGPQRGQEVIAQLTRLVQSR